MGGFSDRRDQPGKTLRVGSLSHTSDPRPACRRSDHLAAESGSALAVLDPHGAGCPLIAVEGGVKVELESSPGAGGEVLSVRP